MNHCKKKLAKIARLIIKEKAKNEVGEKLKDKLIWLVGSLRSFGKEWKCLRIMWQLGWVW
jgi:hypothetical protein